MSYRTFLWLLVACLVNAKNNFAYKVTDDLKRFHENFFEITVDQQRNENLVCSSVSASILLALTAFGGQGNTAREIQNALNLPQLDKETAAGFKAFIDRLNATKDVNIHVANLVSVTPNVRVKDSYSNLTKEFFHSEIIQFQGSPLQIAYNINAWVSAKTNRTIDRLLNHDDIQNDAGVALFNAISFDGKWQTPFDPSLTSTGPFYDLNNKSHYVPIMKIQDGIFRHGVIDNIKAKFIVLPYKDTNYQMIIIYPKQKMNANEFSTLGNNLRNLDYNYIDGHNESEVNYLLMPKFKVESTIDLKPILQKMNITEMFGPKANFDNIFEHPPNNPPEVTKIMQKVSVHVNEDGTKAAVAGASLIFWRTGEVFSVSRPFYFIIRSPEGPLFQGRVILPKSEQINEISSEVRIN